MSQSSTSLHIEAPIEQVFVAITNIEDFPQRAESITKIEFLSETKHGVGTKFRETRMMGKKEATAVLEITEFVENEKVRFVSDEGGTIWDTIFKVSPSSSGSGTQLDLVMDARPYKLMSKIVTPLIIKMIGKFVLKDMDELKAWCEQNVS